MDLNFDIITDWFNSAKDWFNENKDWMLIPVLINLGIVIIGIILMLLTGKSVNGILKFIFILLFLLSPVIGYFIGEYVDPYLEPLFSKIVPK
jgi:hypothetical protein